MKNPLQLSVFALPLLVSTPSAGAATVYTASSFTNSLGGGTGHNISNINWTADFGTSSSITSGVPGSGNYRMGVFDGISASASGFTVEDYIYVQKWGVTNGVTLDTDAMLRTTSLTPFAPSAYTSLTASWHRNGNSAASIRFMIQTGGIWYVADTPTNGTGNGTVSFPALSFDLLASNWTTLGTNVSIGDTSGISYSTLFGAGQTITGVGLYIDNLEVNATDGLTTARFDNLTIEGVPEATTALLGMMGMPLLCLRRRK